jgi:hypothetical protein
MNWADYITYAVHDVDGFYQAGRIPLHILSKRRDMGAERDRKDFYEEVFERPQSKNGRLSRVHDLAEKPSPSEAPSNLVHAGGRHFRPSRHLFLCAAFASMACVKQQLFPLNRVLAQIKLLQMCPAPYFLAVREKRRQLRWRLVACMYPCCVSRRRFTGSAITASFRCSSAWRAKRACRHMRATAQPLGCHAPTRRARLMGSC